MLRWLEYVVFIAILLSLAKPIGLYIARVFERQPTFLDRLLRPVESVLYRLLGVQPEKEMTPMAYLGAFLAFTALGTLLLFLLLMFQSFLPETQRSVPDYADVGRPGGEHGAQLFHDNDMAGLQRRINPALSGPDNRAGLSKLPRRGGRPGRGHRFHSGPRP